MLFQTGLKAGQFLISGNDVAVHGLVGLTYFGQLNQIIVPDGPHFVVFGSVQAAARAEQQNDETKKDKADFHAFPCNGKKRSPIEPERVRLSIGNK
jgi:hypothetical protein